MFTFTARLAPWAASTLLAACAAAPAPQYSIDHPANPAAAAAPMPPEPSALAGYRAPAAVPPQSATPAESQPKEGEHAGHH